MWVALLLLLLLLLLLPLLLLLLLKLEYLETLRAASLATSVDGLRIPVLKLLHYFTGGRPENARVHGVCERRLLVKRLLHPTGNLRMLFWR